MLVETSTNRLVERAITRLVMQQLLGEIGRVDPREAVCARPIDDGNVA
jgi:hypothetical protein